MDCDFGVPRAGYGDLVRGCRTGLRLWHFGANLKTGLVPFARLTRLRQALIRFYRLSSRSRKALSSSSVL